MPSNKKHYNKTIDFGPEPVIDPPELQGGSSLAFLKIRLLPLLSGSSSEKFFIEKGEALLRELWRATHSLRPAEDRDTRGRQSVKIPAMKAIARGIEEKERSGDQASLPKAILREYWKRGCQV
jgi:hypothetical protein